MSRTDRDTRRTRALLATFFSLLLAAGCASPGAGGDAPRPAPVPRAPAASRHRDPLPSSVTLEQAMDLALARNPRLIAAAFDHDAAIAGREVAEGLRLPYLRGVAGYSHSLDPQRLMAANENGESGLFTRDLLGADLVLGVPLYTGGRIEAGIRGADWSEEASAQLVGRVAEELRFEVARVFYGILSQRRLIKSLRFSRGALEEHRRRVADLLSVEKAARVDLLRTEVRLAGLVERLAREESTLLVLTRNLGVLLGLEEGRSVPEPRGELASDTAPVPGSEAAVETALGRRPDLLAARAEREVARESVALARAARFPDVRLEAAYGARWAAGATERPDGSGTSEDTGRIGVVMTLPIFEGGRLDGIVRRERARLAAADARIRTFELSIRLEVETALADLASARVRAETTERSIASARESFRIESERYALGKGAIVDVLDAQSALLDAETAWHRALADAAVARARLELAMGRP